MLELVLVMLVVLTLLLWLMLLLLMQLALVLVLVLVAGAGAEVANPCKRPPQRSDPGAAFCFAILRSSPQLCSSASSRR